MLPARHDDDDDLRGYCICPKLCFTKKKLAVQKVSNSFHKLSLARCLEKASLIKIMISLRKYI